MTSSHQKKRHWQQCTHQSPQVIPNVRIERVDIKVQANGAILSWFDKLSMVSTALQMPINLGD
ncbi:hypothetical protein CY34DRAFT_799382, partial [Suillus luteus UH-Slu-Lm8-n1]